MITFLAGDDMRKSYNTMLRSLQKRGKLMDSMNHIPLGQCITIEIPNISIKPHIKAYLAVVAKTFGSPGLNLADITVSVPH